MNFKDNDGAGSDRKPNPKAPSFDRSADEPVANGSYSFATRSDHEFQLDRSYEPCQELTYPGYKPCLSTERLIVFVSGNSGKKLVCGNDHNQNYKGGPFIAASEFGPGGEFEGVLPPEFMPPDGKIRQTRWNISTSREKFLSQFEDCAKCNAPPYQGGSDESESWQWIQDYDRELFSDIQVELKSKASFDLRRWFSMLSQALRTRVIKRFQMSELSFDHAIPRKRGHELWLLLSVDERRVLQEDLVFRLCRKCNLGKSAKIESREDIIAMYVKINYSGSIAVAKADEMRWALLQSALGKVYGEQSA